MDPYGAVDVDVGEAVVGLVVPGFPLDVGLPCSFDEEP